MITETEEKLTGDDEEWGYRYGCDGLTPLKKAAEHIGVCENTVRKLCEDGFLRKGKRPYKGAKTDQHKRVVICKRSLKNYVAMTKE